MFLFNQSLASELVLSHSLNKQIRKQITKDLRVLRSLDQIALEDWLFERVKYVVDEKAFSVFKLPVLGKAVSIEREDVEYPHSDSLYKQENEKEISEDRENTRDESAVTVMTNLGAALYLQGKKERVLYRMKIPTSLFKSETVSLTSPRAGIIQVGAGLFDRRFTINNQNPDSIANSINRLGVFFHEARHSDGQGSSLAFTHVRCPRGHDLEGMYACDLNANGPYSIGARVVKEMIKACGEDCTQREKEILLLTALDSQNRVLSKQLWTETPEFLE